MIIKVTRDQILTLLNTAIVDISHFKIKELGIYNPNSCGLEWLWHQGKLQSLSDEELLHIYELVTNQYVFDWKEINSIDDLPSERGTYYVLDIETNLITEHYISSCKYNRNEMLQYTHWCRKIIPNTYYNESIFDNKSN